MLIIRRRTRCFTLAALVAFAAQTTVATAGPFAARPIEGGAGAAQPQEGADDPAFTPDREAPTEDDAGAPQRETDKAPPGCRLHEEGPLELIV